MEPYDREWDAYLAESKAIMKAENKLDELYNQIGIEREKETKSHSKTNNN